MTTDMTHEYDWQGRTLKDRNGDKIGTIDALLAQLCIRHDVTMLTADQNFTHVAEHSKLKLWSQAHH